MLLLSLLLFLVLVTPAKAASESDEMVSIRKIWMDNRPIDAFSRILDFTSEDKKLDPVALTELTGVREIQKVVESKGDESIYWCNNRFVVLGGFTNSLRVIDIEKSKFWWLTTPSYPVYDKAGLVVHNDNFFYYIQPDKKDLVVFQYNLESRTSKPLAKFPKQTYIAGYDPTNSWLQFTATDSYPIITINLANGKLFDIHPKITERTLSPVIPIETKTTVDNLVLKYNNRKLCIPYPRDEFLKGYKPEDIFTDAKHQSAVLVKSLWYPGLKILIDLDNKRIYKVFLPEWLDPAYSSDDWSLRGNYLYVWLEKGEKSGLYKISLRTFPDIKQFAELIKTFNLGHQESGGRVSESA